MFRLSTLRKPKNYCTDGGQFLSEYILQVYTDSSIYIFFASVFSLISQERSHNTLLPYKIRYEYY